MNPSWSLEGFAPGQPDPDAGSVNAGDSLQQALALSGKLRCCAPWLSVEPASRSSRRRRLWELDGHAHCPVIGVCLPLASARRLAGKALGGQVLAGDYELHCGLVTDCKRRTRLAEQVNKALDERHALALRAAAACKTTPDLAAWWRAHAPGDGLAGALWAVITHPDCDTGLEQQVLGEVHMRQHQVGHEQRADWGRLQALQRENAAQQAELSSLRTRLAQQAAELGAQREAAQVQAMRLRGDILSRDTRIAQLEQEAASLRCAAPDLPARRVLAEQLQQARERAQALQRALDRVQAAPAPVIAPLRSEMALSRPRPATGGPPEAGPDGLVPGLAGPTSATPSDCTAFEQKPDAGCSEGAGADSDAAGGMAGALPGLRARTVLCVGGRAGTVPSYRALLEGLGAQFQHHDGGQEHSAHRLQASLAAADLVVCQAGCISHDAYWRVKDHCRRTGKRCVFVESPGTGALERALKAALAASPEPGPVHAPAQSPARAR